MNLTVPHKHVLAYYNVLKASSKRQKIDGKMVSVFEGSLVAAFKDTGVSSRYYTPIRTVLVKTDSIEILQRGNKTHLSKVLLRHAPPMAEEWPMAAGDLTDVLPSASLVGDIQRRVSALEGWRESMGKGELNIVEALRNFERRLSKLEKERL